MDNKKELEECREKINKLELELLTERKKYELVLEYSDCGLWEYVIADKKLVQSKKLNGKYQFQNLIIENFRETVLGWGNVHPDDVGVFNAYCDSMDHGDAAYEYDLRAMTDDDYYIWLRYIGKTVYDQEGKPYKSIGKTLNVTKEKRDIDFLIRKASLDSLTHLLNREMTQSSIQGFLQSKKKTGEEGACGALLVLDIDDFKDVNDTWGHLYGDNILERFANILLGSCSTNHIIGRIGGDEFMIFCPQEKNRNKISAIVQRLLMREESIELKNGENLHMSVGIAIFPEDAETFDELYEKADMALYHAKRNGKAQFVFYDRAINEIQNVAEVSRSVDAKRKRMQGEHAVTTMSQMEKLLFEYSFAVMRSNSDFAEAMRLIFSEIGLYFNVERIYLVTYNQEDEQANVLHGWDKDDNKLEPSQVSYDLTKFWNRIKGYFLLHDCFIYVEDGEGQISPEGKLHMTSSGARALIELPIYDDKELIGIMHFEDDKEKRHWTKTEIDALSGITSMLSTYMLRNKFKDELREEIKYTGSAMDSQKLAYYVIDRENYQIQYLSRYTREKFPGAKLNRICYEVIGERKSPCTDCPICGIMEDRTQYATEVYKSEQDTWYTVSASRVSTEEEHQKEQYLMCWTDVTTFLDRVKSTDQLTGIYSYDKFSAELLRKLHNQDNGYAVVFSGIHNFTDINKRFGYVTGDRVLQLFANVCKNQLTECEMICRMKGDDFIFLLEYNALTALEERIETLINQLSETMKAQYEDIPLYFGFGLYEVNTTDFFVGSILDKANTARKIALERCNNRNVLSVYTKEMKGQEASEKRLFAKMRNALKNQEFRVVYQPKVDVATDEIVGAEALLRWTTPSGEEIPTGEFIAAAERSGFIEELDKFVYNTVFAYMQNWEKNYGKMPTIAVNVSRHHLMDESFPAYMYHLSQMYKIPRHKIELEITETLFFMNEDFMLQMIQKLRDYGFGISMDDFGTGYSTLSMIQRLPIDVLKIDGSFFYRNEMNEKNKSIISTIIHLAKALDYTIVCEGVETEEQMNYIKEKKCDLVQGFYCYKPISAEKFKELHQKVK